MVINKNKIRFIQTFATDRECFVKGREEEFPAAEAESHIRAGLAVPCDEPEKPEAKKPVKAK